MDTNIRLSKEELVTTLLEDKFEEAILLLRKHGYISISLIQRELSIGFRHAQRIILAMEQINLINMCSDGVRYSMIYD